jgi:hypothetical protein
MTSEMFSELVSKYNDAPELYLTPDETSISFVHSLMSQCSFDGAQGAPMSTSREFMTAIFAKTGLEVLNVASRGGNCFFHAFWVSYYGSQPDRQDICRLRHNVACRIFSKWTDVDFRSMVTVNPDYSEFHDTESGVFGLSKFLSQVADESCGNYQLEGDGLMFELVAEIFNCVIVIVSVRSEGSLTRIQAGNYFDDFQKSTVYVAWNGLEHSAHYFAFLGNPRARVVKWAEFDPAPMIGDGVDVRDLTEERERVVNSY